MKTSKSFLNVTKPQIAFGVEHVTYSKKTYEQGKKALDEFISKDHLVEDSQERVYIYKMQMGNHVQYGVLGLTSILDYENNIIKKHEQTLKTKVDDLTNLINAQNANIEPVFLTYHGHPNIREKIHQIVGKSESYTEVVCKDGVIHELWLCDTEDSEFFAEAFQKVPCLYIADGHHRTQAAYNLAKMRKEEAIKEGKVVTGKEDFNFLLSLVIPDVDLKIMDFNRLVKSLNGMSEEEFLKKISESYDIIPDSDSAPKQKHNITMYLGKRWYSLTLKKSLVNTSTPLSHLDAEILTNLILDPILDIKDLKTDQRIDFAGGIRGLSELERRCDLDCVAAFALYPITVKEMMDVVEADMIMPPKSTWFEPKPRSGFVVRLFESEQESY